MKIKGILISLSLLLSIGCAAQPDMLKKEEKLIWYTDMMKANEVSSASGKPLFAFFTGSDWCPWCIKLQKDVFAKPEFIKWAEKNVVLVELDFPRNKKLNPELTKQNRDLQQAFQVKGFPIVWMFFLHKNARDMNYTIEGLGSLGYPSGAERGQEELKFLKEANILLEKRTVK
jgi:thioredoxin-related protein